MRYLALLRGINVGGNNKVSMSELKVCFEQEGFTNVSTYINSGNVLFESQENDVAKLVKRCEAAIEAMTGFHVICAVISADSFQKAMADAPSWWGRGGDIKDNALFVIAPATAKEIMKEVGEAKTEYEKVAASGPIIFWSAALKTFHRTRYKNIVGTASYQSITIRNANTTKKLLSLLST